MVVFVVIVDAPDCNALSGEQPVCDAMDPRLFYFERKHTKKEELAAMIYDEITSQYPEDNKHYDIDPQSVFPHKSKKSRRRKRRKSF